MGKSRSRLIDVWSYRKPERLLFCWSLLVIAVGYLLVIVRKTGTASFDWRVLMPLAVYLAAMVIVHVTLVMFKFRGDPILLGVVFFLAGFGMLAQFRMGAMDLIIAENLSSFALPAGLALMLMVILLFRNGRYRLLEPLAILCVFAAIGLLGAIFIWGERYRGALFLPGYINPADLIKIFLIIFLAGFLVRWRKEFEPAAGVLPRLSSTAVIFLLVFWGLAMLLLLLQRDLGMLVLLNAVLIVLLFMATGRIAYLVVGLLCAGVLCMAVYALTSHGQARFLAWLYPFADSTGKSWQILQALSAMYSGGLWGVGLGAGSPQYIPIASSDFIYAVIGEELGFMGCGIVLIFYAVLYFRGYKIAAQIGKPFGRLLATGLVTTLSFQTLLNIGGVTKALPLTGITLPFISHGGSSLLTTFLGVGLLLALSEKEGQQSSTKKKIPIKKQTGRS